MMSPPTQSMEQDDVYKMTYKNRGLLLIFNHENFNEIVSINPRHGTDNDVEKIKKCFGTTLGFEIPDIPKDLSLEGIQMEISKYAGQDHSDKDCLAIFILTHGGKGKLCAKDKEYDPEEIWDKLSSESYPTLAGKPILLFIQACQGGKLDQGRELTDPYQYVGDGKNSFYKMPFRTDFLICCATMEGYLSFRNRKEGARWVTILCEELEANYEIKDLLTILTDVNRKMADDYIANFKKKPAKQASCFSSSLTKALIFGKKGQLS